MPGNCDVRKIKEKNTSAELSGCRTVLPLGAEMSHTGAELSGCRTVLVPKCPGTEVSSIPTSTSIIRSADTAVQT